LGVPTTPDSGYCLIDLGSGVGSGVGNGNGIGEWDRGLTGGAGGHEHLKPARESASNPTEVPLVNRLVALLLLTAAFTPAAVLGALPMVTSIVVVAMVCWILLTARPTATEAAVDPPIAPVS
jgi:hypothetical protein